MASKTTPGMMNGNVAPKSDSSIVNYARLRELLHYNPETGLFTWLIPLRRGVKSGTVAGREKDGYIVIGIGGREYMAHALAWYYMHGEYIPVDHKDRTRGNNVFSNLRKATNSQNQANRGIGVNNNTGVKGVHIHLGKYEAAIQVNGRKIYLGRFDKLDEAAQAYKIAAIEHFGEFAHYE